MEKLTFKLETFEGPLDLLLSLISAHKLDIYDIEITSLLEQYLAYIAQMQQTDLYVASEFLEMAARLVYIKTVSLLPRHQEAEQLKAELTGELLEYQLCKEVAQTLAARNDSDKLFVREMQKIDVDHTYKLSHDIQLLYDAYLECAGRAVRKLPPPKKAFSGIISHRVVPVSARIVFILNKLYAKKQVVFSAFFEQQDRSELVATFLGMLELIKDRRIMVSDDGKHVQLCEGISIDQHQEMIEKADSEWK